MKEPNVFILLSSSIVDGNNGSSMILFYNNFFALHMKLFHFLAQKVKNKFVSIIMSH